MTDTFPIQASQVGNVDASSGAILLASRQVVWYGDVNAADGVTITYSLRLEDGIDVGTAVNNNIQIDDGAGNVIERAATIVVAGQPLHLPFVRR